MATDRIMIADDNKGFLKEFEEILSAVGYETVTVSDGKAVVNKARQCRPDVIMLDLKMPGASGFDIANKLKHTPETSHIPIIAMSGYYPIEKENILIDKSNMTVCLSKPFDVIDIIDRIEMLLNKRHAI